MRTHRKCHSLKSVILPAILSGMVLVMQQIIEANDHSLLKMQANDRQIKEVGMRKVLGASVAAMPGCCQRPLRDLFSAVASHTVERFVNGTDGRLLSNRQ